MDTKYFLYVRKSTDTEDKQVQSLEDQTRVMENKAKSLWIKIVEIFSESMSAKAPWRYRFNEMILRINKGEARGIIAWKLDRLTRNPIDTWTIQYMLQNGTLDKIITNDRDYNPVDAWLLFSVESWMSNQFILDLKKNVVRWMNSKTDKGVFCWRAPEWYKNNKAEKTIEIDIERFDLIRKMWELMLSWRYSVPQIIDIANDEWGLTRRVHWRQWKREIRMSWVYKMFNNIFYTWDFMWKGVIKKWTHKPMITYEEFYEVQRLLGAKWLNMRWKTREFAYTWFIKCWECWSQITAVEKNKIIKATNEYKTYVYYLCTKRKKWCKYCCQYPIKLEDLEKQINEVLNNLVIIPDFKDWVLEVLKDDFKNDLIEKETILNTLTTSLNTQERKLNKLTDSLLEEIISDEEYKIRKKHIHIDIQKYREQINKLNSDKDESLDTTEKAFNFIIKARALFNHWSLKDKKEILLWLGCNFQLLDGKVSFVLNPRLKPMELISEKLTQKKPPLELLKNSTSMGNTSTVLDKNSIWYSQGELNPCLDRERVPS